MIIQMYANFCTDVGVVVWFCAKLMREDTHGVRTNLREDVSETVREAVADGSGC